MNIISINNISKSYGNHYALSSINFQIPEKSIFGLLGPNGAGKTTLIRIITQIIMPDEGNILFGNVPITTKHIRQIGYLPEERGLYKKMKVAEQLLYLAQLKGMPKPDAIKSIHYWLDKFDIRSWVNKKIEDLSKGMQQKIQFIATVVHHPSLLILDEPFSGFDPVNANLIKDEILELKEKGATIIFSTHRMESVEELCDYITLINDTKVILHGSMGEIKNKYRSNIFRVAYEGELNLSNHGFEVIGLQKSNDAIIQAEVKLNEAQSVNDLVSAITHHTNIVSLQEKIPSINEIFIAKVKPTADV